MLLNIEDMSLEEKIGQLFITSCQENTVNGEIAQLITTYHIGGFLIEEHAIHQAKKFAHFNRYLQYYAGNSNPLYIGMRSPLVEESPFKKATTIPSHGTLGKLNNRLYTKQIAEVVASEQRSLGVNVLFAPNLTVADSSENSFGNNIDSVAKQGVAMIQGLQKGDVATAITGIHSVRNISNVHKPDSKRSLLYPFYKAVQENVDIFHIHVLDHTEIQHQIRKEIGFNGVIAYEIPTSLSSVKETAIHIIEALEMGVNLIISLFPYKEQIAIMNEIIERAKRGELDEDKINLSLEQSIKIKRKYVMNNLKPFYPNNTPTRHAQNVSAKIMDKIAQLP